MKHNTLIAISCLWLASCGGAVARPDFTGVWESYPPLHAPAKSPGELFAQGAGEAYMQPGGAPQLKEPYASAYKARLEKSRENNNEPVEEPGSGCLPEGMPGMMSAVLPFEVVQTPKLLVILAEEQMQVRRIHLGGKMPSRDDIVPGYFGYSVGHWEGDTLVVETRGIREDILFLGIPHSNKAELTERLRLTAPDMLEIKFAIEDPTVFVKPYTFTYKYKKNPTYQIAEYVCENDRYSIDSTKLDVRPKD